MEKKKNLVIGDSVTLKGLLLVLEQLSSVDYEEKNEILAMAAKLGIPEDEINNLLGKIIFQIQPVPDFSKMMADFQMPLSIPLSAQDTEHSKHGFLSKQTAMKDKKRLKHFNSLNRRIMNSRR